jgi:acetolactate synthase-1/2/3 large subunit
LDSRQTGTRPETFARRAKIVYVDIEPQGLNKKIKVEFRIAQDIRDFLRQLNSKITHYYKERIKPWKKAVKQYREKYSSYKIPKDNNIEPNFFMYRLSDFLPKDVIICADVGQNQMWAAQTLNIERSQRFLTAGGMGAMGSALPMAIGASYAKPDRTVVVISGDGGFQLNIQELQTIYHHCLPIKIILLNNRCYGMVRQFQEQYFNSRFQSTVIGYSCPDFQKVVSAYKIRAFRISRPQQITQALKRLFKDKQPMFLEVKIKTDALVNPKLSVNKPIEDQDPALSRHELKANMFNDILP